MEKELGNLIEWLKFARDKSNKQREYPENYEDRFFYAGKVEAYNDTILLIEKYLTIDRKIPNYRNMKSKKIYIAFSEIRENLKSNGGGGSEYIHRK